MSLSTLLEDQPIGVSTSFLYHVTCRLWPNWAYQQRPLLFMLIFTFHSGDQARISLFVAQIVMFEVFSFCAHDPDLVLSSIFVVPLTSLPCTCCGCWNHCGWSNLLAVLWPYQLGWQVFVINTPPLFHITMGHPWNSLAGYSSVYMQIVSLVSPSLWVCYLHFTIAKESISVSNRMGQQTKIVASLWLLHTHLAALCQFQIS